MKNKLFKSLIINIMDIKDRKWVFIVNPEAGGGFAKTLVPALKEMIGKHGIDAEVVFTERSGHATELSETYLKNGFGYIIGIGGDGTLNEISRPLINNKNVTIGIIPAGTGNDFIQILGFPNRFEVADWETFFRAETISMDAGTVNGMVFLNGMGLGFDAQVAAENYTAPGKVKKGGKYKYIWHIVKTLLFFREKKMKVVNTGGSHETDCFINTISIGRRFAGGFYLTPKAIANDGLLDVCMIKRLSLPERFSILLKVPKGKHIDDKRVNYYQTKGLRLEFQEEVPFHVDGELNFASKFDVSIIPGALKVFIITVGNIFSEATVSEFSYFVFFDIDRTITRVISGKALAVKAYKRKLMSRTDLLKAVFISLAYRLNLKDPVKIIDDMVSWVKGLPERTMAELCTDVFREDLLQSINAEARDEIKKHKGKNAKLIILSSSLIPVCREVADNLGMDDFICSCLETENGFLTGRSVGPLCFGEEKAVRLIEYCKKHNTRLSDAWYYGDSFSDIYALSAVGNPVCVNPDRRLRKAAIKRNWKIVLWNS